MNASSDTDKKTSAGSGLSAGVRLPPEPQHVQQKYGEYLFGRSFEDPNAPATDGRPNWNSYPIGRVMIRLFSRGVMGATFYTIGGAMISKQLTGYTNYMPLAELGGWRYPLRYLARFTDVVVGSPIKAYAKLVSPAERAEELAAHAVRFRDTADFGYKTLSGAGEAITGRSLGHEAVAMTFDFAMGSMGDAWGRNIANMLDPNIDNGWYKDGKFNIRQFGKDVGQATWTVLSKNQGEDWAAAIPYIYQMRWQRRMIDKIWPGFTFLSDRSLNGGSWLMNPQGQIIGSYAAAGALDLQLRFSGYNWYTLMYRDAYDTLAQKITDWRNGKPPVLHLPENPIEATLYGAASAFRYGLKSWIKAAMYMTPAVPFFWAFRTPQTKYKGLGFSLDANGQATFVTMPDGKPYSYFDGTLSKTVPVQAHELTMGPGGPSLPQSDFGAHFNPYEAKATTSAFDRVVRLGGVASDRYARGLNAGLKKHGFSFNPATVYNWANASISYTPYMIAKAETALATEGVDRGINTMLDGVFALDLGHVKAGLHDIRQELINTANRRGRQVRGQEEPKTLLIPIPAQEAKPEATAPEKPSSVLSGDAAARQIDKAAKGLSLPPAGVTLH